METPEQERTVSQIFVESEQILQVLSSLLAQVGIPMRVLPKTPRQELSFLVPSEYAGQVLSATKTIPWLIHETQESKLLFRRHDPARDQKILDHPILKEPLSRLELLGPKAIAELKDCSEKGSDEVASTARLRLLKLGNSGREALLELMESKLLEEMPTDILRFIRNNNAEKEFKLDTSHRARIQSLLSEANPEIRNRAIYLVEFFRWKEFIPELIALLENEESALEADEALVTITEEDLGFDLDIPSEEKNEIIAKRKEWWSQAKHG